MLQTEWAAVFSRVPDGDVGSVQLCGWAGKISTKLLLEAWQFFTAFCLVVSGAGTGKIISLTPFPAKQRQDKSFVNGSAARRLSVGSIERI